MQSTVGHWVAILVLGLLAAYGIGMYFSQQVNYERMEQALLTATPRELVERGNDPVTALKVEKEDLEDKVGELNKQILELKKKITNANGALLSEQAVTKSAAEKIKIANETNAGLQARAKELEDKLKKAYSQSEQDRQAQKTRLEKQLYELQARQDQLERDKQALSTNNEAMIKSAVARIRALQREKQHLLNAINQKTEAIRRRSSRKSTQVDGKILSVNIAARFCVVNIGRENNVHRGMRFDVVRWRLNKWDDVATIEITKVGSGTSEAVILDKPAVKKVCPVTGYVAKNPEEEYSPYASTEDGKAVHLVKVAQEPVSTMDENDPIQVGDSISNPFFDKDKKIKYVLAGEPVYAAAEMLTNSIRETGGEVLPEVNVETDFIILGRIPKMNQDGTAENQSAEFERYQKTMDIASQYGIPIIREVELYDFLRN